MVRNYADLFWHRLLKRPYRLHVAIDRGSGAPVVLLHGIGRMGETWSELVKQLDGQPVRAVALDLLGFGKSPKPGWVTYTLDDHARAVIRSLERLRLGQQIVFVGHSMGCLIAVRVAYLRPDLAKHLVLYEMPLYAGLPDKARYRMRLHFYFSVYERIINFKPAFGKRKPGMRQRFAKRVMGFDVDKATWKPFIRSLKHAIMEQTTADEIKQLSMPMDVIYGSKDRLVIRGKTQLIFGQDVKNVTSHIIKEKHRITPSASRFLARRIEAAVAGLAEQEIRQQEPAV